MKNILITGASKGIGRALTDKFLREKFTVYVISRNVESLIALNNKNLHIIQADISLSADRQNIYKYLSSVNNLDIINNAALCVPENTHQLNTESLRKHYETNVIGPIELINYLLNNKQVDKVINVSTSAAQTSVESLLSYGTSKASMHLAIEYFKAAYPKTGFANIRPGMVDTPNQEYMRSVPIETFPSQSNFFSTAYKNNMLIPVNQVANFFYWMYLKSKTEFENTYWYINDYEKFDY